MIDGLKDLVASLGSYVRRGANNLERLIDRDPFHIVGYRGFGGGGRVLVLGRVLQNEGLALADPEHNKVRNLLAMLKRLESDPLPLARVRVSAPGGSHELVADDEGFVRGWIEMDTSDRSGWSSLRLDLADPPGGIPASVDAPVLVPPPSASFGVISDMDDTVLQSHVTDFLRAARMVLLENARTRLPFAGVAAFYRALEEGHSGGAGNPIFYVSSSPWNLYDVIAEFLEAQQIPRGPLLLRDWDIGASMFRNAAYKTGVIREILATYPLRRFILIGDSAQEDPEIYAEIVARHPGRILAVYIRNASLERSGLTGQSSADSSAIQDLTKKISLAGSTLVLADDTLAVARHAALHGWIREDALRDIGQEKRADEGGGGKEPAPGVHQETPKPTVVIDPDVRAREID